MEFSLLLSLDFLKDPYIIISIGFLKLVFFLIYYLALSINFTFDCNKLLSTSKNIPILDNQKFMILCFLLTVLYNYYNFVT